MKKTVSTDQAAPAVGPYSQAVNYGDLVFTSGQIALTADGTLINESVEHETRQILKNLEAILSAAGAGFDNVLKATIYATDVEMFSTINVIYSNCFKNDNYPAREFVGVAALPKGARVEISMIAYLGKRSA